MLCSEALSIASGITSVIGSGGKTTLLSSLATEALVQEHTVILTTTTHFKPFEDMPLVDSNDFAGLKQALIQSPVVCVGTQLSSHKLGASRLTPQQLSQYADYVFVEADGSRQLPFKAHEPYEPVIPGGNARCILVVGASGFSRPVREVAHRLDLFCERAQCKPDDQATPKVVARSLAYECAQGIVAPDAVVVNQTEEPERLVQACMFVAALRATGCEVPVCAGSIRDHDLACIN